MKRLLSLFFGVFLAPIILLGQSDGCTGVPSLTVNASCVTTSYSLPGSFSNGGLVTSTCNGTNRDDGWYSFVATSANTQITATATSESLALAIWSACGGGTELGCGNAASGASVSVSITTTIGTTYYVQLHRQSGNNTASMTGTVCVRSIPPPPANDNCTGAVNVPVNTGVICTSSVAGTIANATASSQANGCGGTADDDVWYSFVATNSTHYINLNNIAGSTTDLYHSVYSGTCGSIGTALICSDPENSTVTGLTVGNTYYVRVYSWTSTPGQTSTFDLCIGTPPPPPANDNCTGAVTVPVNSTLTCTSSVSGTIASATASSQANGCGGTADDDVWYSFVATNSTHHISLNNIAGSTTDLYHSVYSGTCGSIGTALICSDPESSIVSGLTVGNTYYVRVYSYTSTTGQTSTFDLCIGTPPPPPANDNCTGAVNVPVNSGFSCTTSVAGTIASATASSQANGCGGTADDDVWYSFVATNSTHYINLNNIAGSTTDLYHSVYSGTCGSIGTALVCSDPNNSTVSGLTVGNTYYVRVYSYTSTTGQNSTFNICITPPPTPPVNDNCAGAINVPVSTTTCTYVNGTIAGATASSQANGCGGTADDDVWYRFTATSTGVQINLTNITGSTSDLYHSVYSGTCGSIGTALVCSDPNNSTVTGLIPGNTYYVRVFSYTSTAGQTSMFDICIQQVGPCGTPNNQDYCVAPAILTQGAGNFSANTSGTYTEDAPANLTSVFCGSIENNSWYEFVATSTTHTFNFTSVGGAGCSYGIQAEVYAVTEDINGCCTNFTSMSNCWNPGIASTGTVTATGLTIGQTYRLMVDGNAGSICDFVVSNWTATGIIVLGVTYTDFSAVGMQDGNLIKWETSTEINSDYFEVERSIDGVNFEELKEIDGMGTKYSPTTYSYFDNYRIPGTIYYRLKHVDEDGERSYSDILVLQKAPGELVSVYPNPVTDQLFVNLTHENPIKVSVYSAEGLLVGIYEMSNTGNETISIPTKQLKSGVYLLKFSGDIKVIETQKFIKK